MHGDYMQMLLIDQISWFTKATLHTIKLNYHWMRERERFGGGRNGSEYHSSQLVDNASSSQAKRDTLPIDYGPSQLPPWYAS